MMHREAQEQGIHRIYKEIKEILTQARSEAYRTVIFAMVQASAD